MPNDEDLSPISKLLRMRRDEQPPPEYFEDFLREFQRRQRAEMLRRPAWRIALDRLQARFGDVVRVFGFQFAPSQLAYGGASVAVLVVAGVFTANMLQHPGTGYPPAVASASTPAPFSASLPAQIQPVDASLPTAFGATGATQMPSHLTLNPGIPFPDLFSAEAPLPGVQVIQPDQIRPHPRYILDARPASYEPPSSF